MPLGALGVLGTQYPQHGIFHLLTSVAGLLDRLASCEYRGKEDRNEHFLYQ